MMYLKSRRNFLKSSFLGSGVLVFCSGELFGAVSPLETLEQVQLDLFPNTKDVPTIQEVGASAYLSSILHHPRVTDTEKMFIRNGVQWLNEESLEKYKKKYIKLLKSQREEILKDISQYRWGERWIHTIFTYIFEAMFGDPLYGVNKNQVGWRWLNHEAGKPRPKEALL